MSRVSLRAPGFTRTTDSRALPRPGQPTTDAYLLGLARVHDGLLATFDRAIPVEAVVGARRGRHLAVITA